MCFPEGNFELDLVETSLSIEVLQEITGRSVRKNRLKGLASQWSCSLTARIILSVQVATTTLTCQGAFHAQQLEI